MRKTTALLCILLAGLVISSCGTVYSRAWAVNAQSLTDTLSISGDTFRLERTSSDGTSVWEGKFTERGERWIFDITSWKPANAPLKRLNPAVRYIYQIHKFSRGISFLDLVDVIGTSSFQFIQTGDFQVR